MKVILGVAAALLFITGICFAEDPPAVAEETPPVTTEAPKVSSETPPAPTEAPKVSAETAPVPTETPKVAPATPSIPAGLPQELVALLSTLKPASGDITVGKGLATLKVPDAFSYYNAKDAETILTRIWGNPPGAHPLGLLMPAGMSPASKESWAVVIQFEESGYVKDDDAEKIDYTKMMKEMQSSEKEFNDERKKRGYDEVHLIGWAKPPSYDKDTHKLYWAKEVQFGGQPDNTLNYNIRILGRRGVLILNAVSSMSMLPEIDKKVPDILSMVDFNEGHRYADFDPKMDKLAGYGIAALIAGGAAGVAMKAGLFKGLWIAILALKKFIIVGIIAIAGFFKKLVYGSQDKQKPLPPST